MYVQNGALIRFIRHLFFNLELLKICGFVASAKSGILLMRQRLDIAFLTPFFMFPFNLRLYECAVDRFGSIGGQYL